METGANNIGNTEISKRPDFLEWQECRSSIARFDDAILNIRKYGFTLVTLLLSADGYAFAKLYKDNDVGAGPLVGVYLALMLLITGLFRMDRFHEIFLRAAVERSKYLEKRLDFFVSRKISEYAVACRTAIWGHLLYMFFCFANFILAIGVIFRFDSLSSFSQSFLDNWLLASGIFLIAIVSVISILRYHCDTKKKVSEFATKPSER